MKTKKIMFILPRLHTNILPLIRTLNQSHYKVKVLAFYSYKGKHSEEHDNVDISIVGFSKIIKILPESKKLKFGVPSLLCFKQILQNKPDIIFVRGFLPSSALVHYFSKLVGIKTVMYTQKPYYGWKPSKLRQYLQSTFFPKRVFTTSPGNIERKEISIQNYSGKTEWEYIPFVAEVSERAKKRSYFHNNRINVLLVAKFSKRKMILEFLQVFKGICEERNDLYLTLVGTILDETILEKVEKFIKENNLPVNVKVSVPHTQMGELYLKNDVFVLPAIREPASVSQLEAMCHGLAVVCSNDNGTAYYIKPGKNGEVFDADNFNNDLEQKFRWVIDDKERLQKLGQESINIVEKNHSGDKFLSFINKNL